jgi:hypothetical protein
MVALTILAIVIGSVVMICIVRNKNANVHSVAGLIARN